MYVAVHMHVNISFLFTCTLTSLIPSLSLSRSLFFPLSLSLSLLLSLFLSFPLSFPPFLSSSFSPSLPLSFLSLSLSYSYLSTIYLLLSQKLQNTNPTKIISQSFPLAMYMPMHTKCCQEATAKFNNAVTYLYTKTIKI